MMSCPLYLMKRFLPLLVVLCLAHPAAVVMAADGIFIDSVAPGAAAEKAGLKGGDRIVEMAGRSIRTLPDLESVLGDHEGGDQLPLTVLRDGKSMSFHLILDGEPGTSPRLGVNLSLSPGTVAESGKAISSKERREILNKIASELRKGYIYEDKGNAFAAQVEKAAAADRFEAQDTRGKFVAAVNDFLLEVSNDKHLRLRPGPSPQKTSGTRRVIKRGPAPGNHAPGGHDAKSGHGSKASPDSNARREAMIRKYGEFGVRESRILDGNIGYLNMGMFADSEAAKPKIDEAMNALAGTDALIIDLGNNGGGSPWMVRYLSGFFFSGPTHLTDTWARGMESPRERWTMGNQPTDAFVEKPVYILTSSRTFSAAESFTFGLATKNRVTLVGERTGGGGHFGDMTAVSPDLMLFMPAGRTYNTETGKGWEAEGIEPQIKVRYSNAIDKAIEAIKASAPAG